MGACGEEGLWIDGERVPARSGRYSEVVNPASGEVLARVAEGGAEDVGGAVAAARRSFEHGPWRRATAAERARVLQQLADRLRAAAAELAVLESRSVGKPIQEARGEIEMGAACFQYYAGLLPAFGGQTVPVGAPGTGLTFREPVGVCGLIVPRNFPFAITTWKVAPALALGKWVEVEPASADIERVSLALGGKSANLIFADDDVEKAGASISGALGNAGQDCCARSRVLVERPVYEEIVERFVAHARALRVGDPLDETTE